MTSGIASITISILRYPAISSERANIGQIPELEFSEAYMRLRHVVQLVDNRTNVDIMLTMQ